MLLVRADRMAHRSISGSRSILGSFSARCELLVVLVEQVVVPVVLLPLGVHDKSRWRTKTMAGSGQFEQES